MKHLRTFKYIHVRTNKEHIMTSLEILRNIYINDLVLRKFFLNIGGIELIYEYIKSGDPEIIRDALFNIEDLIYKNEEALTRVKGSKTPIKDLVYPDIVAMLMKLQVPRMLYDFYNEYKLDKEKFSKDEEDLKLLLNVFSVELKNK